MMLLNNMSYADLLKLRSVTNRQLLIAQNELTKCKQCEVLSEDITEYQDTLEEIEQIINELHYSRSPKED